jgi:hypothetical protein
MAAETVIANSYSSSSRVFISYSLVGAFIVSTDDTDHPADELLQLLRDNQLDLSVVEGLRLFRAFRKINDPSDRRILLEMAERLAK